MSTVLTLPDGANATEWTVPKRAAYAVQSPYTGKTTAADTGAALSGWRATVSLAANGDIRAWRAWMLGMLGPVNFTDLVAVQSPQVSSDTNPTIGTATSTTQATLAGLPVSVTGYLLPGSLMTIYTGADSTLPRLVVITNTVTSDGAGAGVVQWQPPIGGLVAGRVCVVKEPFCRMRLTPPYDLGYAEGMAGIFQPGALALEEVIP